ncbi:MAG: DUF1294 domain-containing protein [Muribaculaceae bacterium]|nr:DUF1294 domain-containing protein [Muribaculaceae bacterium]
MPGLYYIFLYLWLINIATFAVYGYDKHQAYYAKYRVPEFVLILLAVIGGAFGALMGMWFFRHKIRKPLFYITLPLLVAAMIAGSFLLRFPYAPLPGA